MWRSTVLVLAFAATAALAAPPTTVSHQARILDTLGSPLSGQVTLTFQIHRDATSTGTPLWQETWSNAPLNSGYFAGALGSHTPFPSDLFADGPWFLATLIGSGPGATEVGPRTQILAVPVALTSQRAEVLSQAPVACDDPSHYGRMYFDTDTNRFQGCDDRGWRVLGSGGGGGDIPVGGSGAIDDPGRSCLDILNSTPGTPDGLYWIDPNGDGQVTQVRCDMTRAGGGWTFGLKTWYQSGIHGQTGPVGTVLDALALEGGTYKLSDDDIRDVIGPDFRFDVLADQAGHNTGHSTGNFEYVVLENYTASWRFDALVQPSQSRVRITSYRSADDAVAWEGAFECGNSTYMTTAARGINCYVVSEGINPYGGPYCDIRMGTSSNGGYNRFGMSDSNEDSYLYICNGAQHSSSYTMNHRWWFRERPIERTNTIGTQGNPGDSCKDILNQEPGATSGLFWIEPGGIGPAVQVQCDMETQGGGWTLGLKAWHGNPANGNGAAVGSVSDALIIRTRPYKLADAQINAIIGDGIAPYDILATQKGYNSSYSIGNLEYVTISNFTGAFTFSSLMPDSVSTTPVFRSYRVKDDALMWEGRLACGTSGGVHPSGWGLNCNNVVSGPNPAGGAGCSPSAWPTNISHNTGWHQLYMSEHNSDSYMYVCNGAQHSSGHDMSHLFWFREST